MATYKVLREFTELTRPPIAKTVVEGTKIIVELNDDENMIQLEFSPFQALRVTTADCFALPEETSVVPRMIIEIENSGWISQLKASLFDVDETANFMDRSHHFLVPTCDDFIEIIAWRMERL